MNKLIIANWKMNLSFKESVALAKQFKQTVPKRMIHELVLCPDFSALQAVGDVIGSRKLKLGAQSVFWHSSGSFTGEVSPLSLEQLGCSYVIVGHSERRTYLGETDEMVNHQLKELLKYKKLIPVLCIGETLSQRKQWKKVLREQIKKDLAGISKTNLKGLVIAYEPVWAIGTGKTIRPIDAVEAYTFIFEELRRKGLPKSAFRLIYGGSVKADNVHDLAVFDGYLVGGASLKASEFYKIANNV